MDRLGGFIVLNATFNNISVISWRRVGEKKKDKRTNNDM